MCAGSLPLKFVSCPVQPQDNKGNVQNPPIKQYKYTYYFHQNNIFSSKPLFLIKQSASGRQCHMGISALQGAFQAFLSCRSPLSNQLAPEKLCFQANKSLCKRKEFIHVPFHNSLLWVFTQITCAKKCK